MAPRTADAVVLEVETPHGLARAHVQHAPSASAALVLGHGAAGGIGSGDLQAVSAVALEQGVTVALVEQPYRVAGRRSPAPAGQLDAAWRAVLDRLAGDELRTLSVIAGGRSSGARVACRTAEAVGAVAVLCLAFPLQPPRRSASGERPTRLDELELVTVPTLVVQGIGDPFGMPPPGPLRTVVKVKGNHSLRSDLDGLRDAVRNWLEQLPVAAAGGKARR